MEDVVKKRYVGQDVVNLFLGIWAFLTPGVFGYHAGAGFVANYVIAGIPITFFAGAAVIAFPPWQEGMNMALGAWLLVSPWVPGFSAIPSMMWSAVVIGVLVVICSAFGLIKRQSHEHMAK